MSEKVEKILVDISAILPGVGLILGWISYSFFLSVMPSHDIKFEDHEPMYKKVKFVKIPNDQEFIGHPPNDVQPTSFRIIYQDVPILDKTGMPVLKLKEKMISGKGKAKITESEIKEVLIPILKQPPWTYGDLELPSHQSYEDPKPKTQPFQQPPKWLRMYQANIEFKHTGIYYTKKKVEFDIGFTKESLAVRFATIASLLSLGLVIYRYVKSPKKSISFHP